ncbi:hypothetical protein FRC17_004553 [Serendipita sp. 399]|nr:hypothetical protein FRC17_004553 [Serendipita sp. 399]
MSLPASATLLRVSDLNASLIGEKVRVFGYLSLLDDSTSALGVLHTKRWQATKANQETKGADEEADTKSGAANVGMLIDISLCGEATALFRESKTLIMAMGSIVPLESISSRTRRWIKLNRKSGLRLEIDPTMALQAIMLRDASGVDLRAMEVSITNRRAYEQNSLSTED